MVSGRLGFCLNFKGQRKGSWATPAALPQRVFLSFPCVRLHAEMELNCAGMLLRETPVGRKIEREGTWENYQSDSEWREEGRQGGRSALIVALLSEEGLAKPWEAVKLPLLGGVIISGPGLSRSELRFWSAQALARSRGWWGWHQQRRGPGGFPWLLLDRGVQEGGTSVHPSLLALFSLVLSQRFNSQAKYLLSACVACYSS